VEFHGTITAVTLAWGPEHWTCGLIFTELSFHGAA